MRIAAKIKFPNARFAASAKFDPLKLLQACQNTKIEPIEMRARRTTAPCTPETLTNPLIFAIAAG